MRETPATIEAAFPWIEQTRALVRQEELGGLAEELSPATADLARLIDRASELLPQTDLASKCLRDVVLPAGDLVVQDEFTNGEENYKEFFYALVGIAGEGQNFDGNGMYVRFQTGGGSQTLSLGAELDEPRRSSSATSSRRRWATVPRIRASARPTSPRCPATRRSCPTSTGPRRRSPRRAARRRDGAGHPRATSSARKPTWRPCARSSTRSARQEGGVGGEEGQVKTAIRKHLPDFLAILGLLIVAAVVVVGDPRQAAAHLPALGAGDRQEFFEI